MIRFFAALVLAASEVPATARQYDIIQPIPAAVTGNVQVTSVEVSLSVEATEAMAPHEAKAFAKRTATAATIRPVPADYDTLPFADMFPLVMEDVTRQWGLAGGRRVKLFVTIAEFGTANAGKAILAGGSPDVMFGLVEVEDAGDGTRLGLFTVRVVNRHMGWSGMLIRGGGIRERLSEEFALETSRVLSGRKSRKVKVRAASN